MTEIEFEKWQRKHPDIDLTAITKKRNILAKSARIIKWVFNLGIVGTILYCWLSGTSGVIIIVYAYACFVVSILIGAIYNRLKGGRIDWYSCYKETLVPTCLNEVFPNAQISINYETETNDKSSVLFLNDIIYLDDLRITNCVSDKSFQQLGIIVEYMHDGQRLTCAGHMLLFKSNKRTPSPIIIKTKQSNALKSMIKYKEEQKIETESTEFNNIFECYGVGHDVFYMLTPILIERITALRKYNKGGLFVILIENNIVFGILDDIHTFHPFNYKGEEFGEVTPKMMIENIINDVENLQKNVEIIRNGKIWK